MVSRSGRNPKCLLQKCERVLDKPRASDSPPVPLSIRRLCDRPRLLDDRYLRGRVLTVRLAPRARAAALSPPVLQLQPESLESCRCLFQFHGEVIEHWQAWNQATVKRHF